MKNILKEQIIPLVLTIITFGVLSVALYFFLILLNLFPAHEKIVLELRKQDILIGFTIYLKTAIDFAIFIGNLMSSNPGWKKRISIEIGTAVGNAFGTILILIIWNFFKEVPILMVIMIMLASLVLLEMAEESFDKYINKTPSKFLSNVVFFIQKPLGAINRITKPVSRFIIPNVGLTKIKKLSLWNLTLFSFTIPFILGLDDFAGYIPLFSIINVFGFSIGVFLGHMILNLGLFISPHRTVAVVKSPFVLLIGGLAFVAIAVWGFYEIVKIFISLV